MKPLAPNTLLQNRYLIVQLIGKGGMGEVYLAVDQRLGSAIAIKRTFFTEDDHLAGAFEREARTLARLRHPVLPKVSDNFTENEIQYLVMEHISGDDLSKRLENNKKPFPINWVLFWADQLLDALNYLHSHEPPIIHRDIKPQNLKLTDDNQIVLLDFGLAKDSVGQTKITTTGSVVGFTPHYAPMEQIRGTGTNPKSDIYSLSTTLYQLLTNTVPFDALTRADSLLNGVADPVPPINEINKEVPKLISEIIIKGMSVSQEQRFGTAREMQKTLRDAYSAMQNQMAAQTIAFNLQNEAKPDGLPQVQPGMDNFATLVNEPPPFPQNDNSTSSQKTEVINQAEISANNLQPDFEATMKMDDFPAVISETPQTGIKTEVFLADEVSEKIEPTETKMPEVSSVSPADVTVPLISYGSQPIKKSDSVPVDFPPQNKVSADEADFKTSEEKIGKQPDFLKTESISKESRTEQNFPPPTETPSQFVEDRQNFGNVNHLPPPVQKKPGGKGLAIGAGLFALLILLVGAGAGGWYVYKNYVAVESPPATPEFFPSVVTSPETTPEPTVAESETDNTNSEVVATGNTNTDSANNDATNTGSGNTTTVTTSTPKTTQTVRPAVQPTPRQTQVVTVNTPRPTPQIKKTPEPQSTRQSRTDLIKP
ncbi:MAG: serine/threonine protein kinase [Pyrinomonadaceae bacterium]